MEKRAVIEPGRTPPEAKDATKAAAAGTGLESHVTQRLADLLTEALTADHVIPHRIVSPQEPKQS